MASPFFSKRILKSRRWPIVPYSYIHSADNKGDDSFSKEGIRSGISSPVKKIAFHKEGTGKR
jgi:hypothetical protein